MITRRHFVAGVVDMRALRHGVNPLTAEIKNRPRQRQRRGCRSFCHRINRLAKWPAKIIVARDPRIASLHSGLGATGSSGRLTNVAQHDGEQLLTSSRPLAATIHRSELFWYVPRFAELHEGSPQ
jgi:hypothetical protein